jgi:hypothetical protein
MTSDNASPTMAGTAHDRLSPRRGPKNRARIVQVAAARRAQIAELIGLKVQSDL